MFDHAFQNLQPLRVGRRLNGIVFAPALDVSVAITADCLVLIDDLDDKVVVALLLGLSTNGLM